MQTQSNRSAYRADARHQLTGADFRALHVIARCQRQRDRRAMRDHARAEASRAFVLRVALPVWAVAALATACAVVGL